MKILNINEVKGKRIAIPGFARTMKDLLFTDNMTVRLGIIPPAQANSRHVHENSEEICYIVKGKGLITANDETKIYDSNYLIHIPPGVYHQFQNTGDRDLIIFVVYSPPAKGSKK